MYNGGVWRAVLKDSYSELMSSVNAIAYFRSRQLHTRLHTFIVLREGHKQRCLCNKNIFRNSLLQYDLHLLDRGYHYIPLTHKTYNTTETLTAGDIYSWRGNSFSRSQYSMELSLLVTFPILILDTIGDLLVITTLLDLMLKK